MRAGTRLRRRKWQAGCVEKADITDFGLIGPRPVRSRTLINSAAAAAPAARPAPGRRGVTTVLSCCHGSLRRETTVLRPSRPTSLFSSPTGLRRASIKRPANGNNETAFAAQFCPPAAAGVGPVLSAYRLRTEAAPPSSRAPARALVLSPDGSDHASFVSERRSQCCVARHCSRMVRRNARPYSAPAARHTLVRAGWHRPRSFSETYRSTGRSVMDTSRARGRVVAPEATRRAGRPLQRWSLRQTRRTR